MELGGPELMVGTVGGEDVLGVSAAMVLEGLGNLLTNADRVLVIGDIGSTFIATETAIELGGFENRVKIVDAPMVEGAIAAAMVLASGGSDEDAAREAQEASLIKKR